MAGRLWPFQHRWCHTAALRTIEPLTQALFRTTLNSLIFKSIRSVIIMEEGGWESTCQSAELCPEQATIWWDRGQQVSVKIYHLFTAGAGRWDSIWQPLMGMVWQSIRDRDAEQMLGEWFGNGSLCGTLEEDFITQTLLSYSFMHHPKNIEIKYKTEKFNWEIGTNETVVTSN